MTEVDGARPGWLLARAYERWAASAAWTLRGTSNAVGQHEAAVRPGLQWISMWDGQHRVLIEGGTAFIQGHMFQLSMVGYNTDAERLISVVGRRWLVCDAAAYLKRGADHSAIGMFGKYLTRLTEDPVVTSVTEAGGVKRWAMRCGGAWVEVEVGPDEQPVLVALAPFKTSATSGLALTYDPQEPLALPDPAQEGVIGLAEVSAALSPPRGRRRPVRPSGRARRTVTVEVARVSGEALPWSVRSEDLASALGVGDGLQAEAAVLHQVNQAAPHLLTVVEFDSYDEVFSAYAADKATAQALRRLVEDLAGDSRPTS